MGRLLLFIILLPLAGLMFFCLAAWLSRKVRGCSVWTLPRGGSEQDSRVFVTFPQTFQITADGTVTVSKLGNYVTRATNDAVILNGVIVQ